MHMKFGRDIIIGGSSIETTESIPLIGYLSSKSKKSSERHRNYLHFLCVMLLNVINSRYPIDQLKEYIAQRKDGIEKYYEVDDITSLLVLQQEIIELFENSDFKDNIEKFDEMKKEFTTKNRNKHKISFSVKPTKDSSVKPAHKSHKSMEKFSFNELKFMRINKQPNQPDELEHTFEELQQEAAEIKSLNDDIDNIFKCVCGSDLNNQQLEETNYLFSSVQWLYNDI
ncbi:hypothetical protein QTN25_006738 [Entamoeba marina]